MAVDTAEVLHQLIELVERRSAIALDRLANKPKLLEDGDSIIKFLPGEGDSPMPDGRR